MAPSLIDTDILFYYMKGYISVIEKVVDYLSIYPTLNISHITYYEILKGLEYKQATRQIADFENLIKKFNLINVNLKSLQISGKIYGQLRRQGIIIGTSDLLIAGIAIENDLELITNNVKHFQSIEYLKIKNWKN